MSSSEKTKQTLSDELDVTKSQLSSVQHELNTVQRSCRQQADLLSRATTTLTSLADQMNRVITADEKNESKAVSSSVTTE